MLIIDNEEFRLIPASLESLDSVVFNPVYDPDLHVGQEGSFEMQDGRKVWFTIDRIEIPRGQ